MDGKVDLTTDKDVRVLAVLVCEKIQGHDNGAIGRVLERDYTKSGIFALDVIKDVLDRVGWKQFEFLMVKHSEGGLSKFSNWID